MGGLVGMVGPWSGWLPGPALCGGCGLLVGRVGSWGGTLGLVIGEVGVQEILGLVSAHWWLRPSSGANASPLAGRAKSWGLAEWPRDPRACVWALVCGAGSWNRWLQGLGCLKACVGRLVGTSRAQPVPWLVLAGWWLGWQAAGLCLSWTCSLWVGDSDSEARAGLLWVGPAHWWAELDSRVSGCRALRVLGLVPT